MITIDLQHISQSIEIKAMIVKQDPTEKGMRKILNAGHTIGHAFEAYSYEHTTTQLLHGEAIAIGLLCEAFISLRKGLLTADEVDRIERLLLPHIPLFTIDTALTTTLIQYIMNDKKNADNKLLFSLIGPIGTCSFDIEVTEIEIADAIKYYSSIKQH